MVRCAPRSCSGEALREEERRQDVRARPHTEAIRICIVRHTLNKPDFYLNRGAPRRLQTTSPGESALFGAMFYVRKIQIAFSQGALLLMIWGGLCAQVFSQKSYNTAANANSRAAKAYQEGILAAQSGKSEIAIGFLEKAAKIDPKLIDAPIALGDLHEAQQRYEEARNWYSRALAMDSAYAPHALYYLGRCEFYLQNFEAAAALAERYIALPQANPALASKAASLKARARFVAHAYSNPVPFKPESLGPGVNTQYDEYFPSITGDEQTLIFTRQINRNEDFYMSKWTNGAWQKATPVAELNTKYNEGALAISPDGSWLTFTACNRNDEGAKGSCDLYWSIEREGVWTKPAPFGGAINTQYWESQPTIGADNRTIIFASERPGGYGGKDLWITTRPIGGKWTKPENLGPGINTPGNEHTPFLHPDGQTLYFSSDSLPGMGGDDLFVVRRQPDGSWGAPQTSVTRSMPKATKACLSSDSAAAKVTSPATGPAAQAAWICTASTCPKPCGLSPSPTSRRQSPTP